MTILQVILIPFVIYPWILSIINLFIALKNKKDYKQVLETTKQILNTLSETAKNDALIIKNEDRINNIVDMLRRNARVSALTNKTGTMNSPLMPSELTKPYYDAIKEDLLSYYNTIGVFLTDRELFEDIQRRFGPLIEEKICKPLQMYSNECIELAIGYIRSETAA